MYRVLLTHDAKKPDKDAHEKMYPAPFACHPFLTDPIPQV